MQTQTQYVKTENLVTYFSYQIRGGLWHVRTVHLHKAAILIIIYIKYKNRKRN